MDGRAYILNSAHLEGVSSQPKLSQVTKEKEKQKLIVKIQLILNILDSFQSRSLKKARLS